MDDEAGPRAQPLVVYGRWQCELSRRIERIVTGPMPGMVSVKWDGERWTNAHLLTRDSSFEELTIEPPRELERIPALELAYRLKNIRADAIKVWVNMDMLSYDTIEGYFQSLFRAMVDACKVIHIFLSTFDRDDPRMQRSQSAEEERAVIRGNVGSLVDLLRDTHRRKDEMPRITSFMGPGNVFPWDLLVNEDGDVDFVVDPAALRDILDARADAVPKHINALNEEERPLYTELLRIGQRADRPTIRLYGTPFVMFDEDYFGTIERIHATTVLNYFGAMGGAQSRDTERQMLQSLWFRRREDGRMLDISIAWYNVIDWAASSGSTFKKVTILSPEEDTEDDRSSLGIAIQHIKAKQAFIMLDSVVYARELVPYVLRMSVEQLELTLPDVLYTPLTLEAICTSARDCTATSLKVRHEYRNFVGNDVLAVVAGLRDNVSVRSLNLELNCRRSDPFMLVWTLCEMIRRNCVVEELRLNVAVSWDQLKMICDALAENDTMRSFWCDATVPMRSYQRSLELHPDILHGVLTRNQTLRRFYIRVPHKSVRLAQSTLDGLSRCNLVDFGVGTFDGTPNDISSCVTNTALELMPVLRNLAQNAMPWLKPSPDDYRTLLEPLPSEMVGEIILKLDPAGTTFPTLGSALIFLSDYIRTDGDLAETYRALPAGRGIGVE